MVALPKNTETAARARVAIGHICPAAITARAAAAYMEGADNGGRK
jgi:hypothetical protein